MLALTPAKSLPKLSRAAKKDPPVTVASTPATAPDADPNPTPKAPEKPTPIGDTPQSPVATPVIQPTEAASTETPAPAPPDPKADTPAARETQDKITSMQQMFEQRKQMIANQAVAPKQP